MRLLPWVGRGEHREAVAWRDRRIAELEKQLRLILRNHFNVQMEDEAQATAAPVAEPEPEMSASDQAAEDWEERQRQQKAHLKSLARTNPSRLGAALEQIMRENRMQAARAARPAETLFATAREQALKHN